MSGAVLRLRLRAGRLLADGQASAHLGHEVDTGNRKPGGAWARWHFDGRRLVAEVDELGFVPLFYAARSDELLIGTSIVELARAGASTELDLPALAVFAGCGSFVGNDTPFSAIKVVPPGGTLVWDGRLRLAEPERPLGSALALEREELVREYRTRFLAALERRPPPAALRLVVPLSGGRDSRLIVAGLLELGWRPDECVGVRRYWRQRNTDPELAARVAGCLGLPFRLLPQPPRHRAEARKNVLTHLLADEHAWFLPVGDDARTTPSVLYQGCGGDVLSTASRQTPSLLEAVRAGRFAEAARELVPGAGVPVAAGIAAPEVLAAARERVAAELARCAPAPNALGAYLFWNRTRREIGLMPYAMCSQAACCYTPYVDRGLYELAMSVPVERLEQGRIQEDALASLCPAAGKLPLAGPAERRRPPLDRTREWAPVLGYGLGQDPARALLLARLGPGALGRDLARLAGRGPRGEDLVYALLYRWQLEALTLDPFAELVPPRWCA